ncbi:hypothetical protein BDK51DRAFT_26101 [Blyttiomyces helicus]|uniref:Uncharacterized protein n=1 Tax=Blyttiomyces helicus TaxID=388810 RepID=A0A4P9W0I8_9FUNG|nr:hypothetical protein BDK51DRAFT_26101 [Blyttiomyces helicus]|eukprot:RKO84623.1 hypothetical protein BDK51DRAFT_26101 [Blyttiomyces helicus]
MLFLGSFFWSKVDTGSSCQKVGIAEKSSNIIYADLTSLLHVAPCPQIHTHERKCQVMGGAETWTSRSTRRRQLTCCAALAAGLAAAGAGLLDKPVHTVWKWQPDRVDWHRVFLREESECEVRGGEYELPSGVEMIAQTKRIAVTEQEKKGQIDCALPRTNTRKDEGQ